MSYDAWKTSPPPEPEPSHDCDTCRFGYEVEGKGYWLCIKDAADASDVQEMPMGWHSIDCDEWESV